MTNHSTENWQRLAGLRQGIINRLEKRVTRLEAELAAVTASHAAATARLAMYDQREAA